MEKVAKVMIFGVFDDLHAGHRFFINNAKKFGNKLIIVATQNEAVKILKNHQPQFSIKKRMAILKKEFPNLSIQAGDKKINTWHIIKKNKPNLIITGYDQIILKNALKKISKDYNFKLIQIKKSFKGSKMHSSLLSKK
jgi:FAD synthetase